LATADMEVIPADMPFNYWTEVAFAKVFATAAKVPGSASSEAEDGLVEEMVKEGVLWDCAMFPSYMD
jgi:hypothetical protein